MAKTKQPQHPGDGSSPPRGSSFTSRDMTATTVEDIVFESGTSKGSFYHYFDGKDALMGTLAYVFDEKYEDADAHAGPGEGRHRDAGLHQPRAVCDDRVQRVHRPADPSAVHPTAGPGRKASAGPEPGLLSACCGRSSGRVRSGASSARGLAQEEIVRAFAMWERAQLYDWCLCGGDYSLVSYAEKMTPLFLESFRARENKILFFVFTSIPSFCTSNKTVEI